MFRIVFFASSANVTVTKRQLKKGKKHKETIPDFEPVRGGPGTPALKLKKINYLLIFQKQFRKDSNFGIHEDFY